MPALQNLKHYELDGMKLALFLNLWETHSLRQTASKLGISVPHASRELSKMRRIMDDELFVRTGNTMLPTAAASLSEPYVREAAGALEAVSVRSRFNPETLARRFRIGACDNAIFYALTPVISKIFSAAPHVGLDFCDIGAGTFDELTDGSMDLAIYPRVPLGAAFHGTELFTTGYCAVVRAGHPLLREAEDSDGLTREMVFKYRQVEANAQPNKNLPANGPAQGVFAGKPDSTAVSTPFFLTAPFLLLNTDFVAVMPLKTAGALIHTRSLAVIPFTDESPTLSPRLIWHKRVHDDPANQWLRSLIITYAKEEIPAE